MSEKPLKNEWNTVVGGTLEGEEGTTDHVSSAYLQGTPSDCNDASNEGYDKLSKLEDKLKEEWNELSMMEIEDWFNVIVGAVDTLTTEYDSSNVMEDKGSSWSKLIKMLTAFREAEINENNAIFAKFLDYLREKREKEPSDTLTEEEENIWNDIKLLKQEKDAKWKEYHVGTWKYWFQKEFPTGKQIKNE